MDITNIQDITTVPESQESLEYVVYTLYHIRIQVTGKVSKNEKSALLGVRLLSFRHYSADVLFTTCLPL